MSSNFAPGQHRSNFDSIIATSFATLVIRCIKVLPKANSVDSYSHFDLPIICLESRISFAISLEAASLVSLSFWISYSLLTSLLNYCRSFSMLQLLLASIVLMCSGF